MRRGGKHASWLQRGSFPNCTQFQRTGWGLLAPAGAMGTIVAHGEVDAIVWEKSALLSLLENNPEMRSRMDHVVLEALLRRLMLNPGAANLKDYMRVSTLSRTRRGLERPGLGPAPERHPPRARGHMSAGPALLRLSETPPFGFPATPSLADAGRQQDEAAQDHVDAHGQ